MFTAQTGELLRFNRTFMELKYDRFDGGFNDA